MAATAAIGNDAERLGEVERRLAWMRELLDERGARGVVLGTRRNFAWMTVGGLNHVAVGSDAGAVPLLVTAAAAVALAPTNEAARIADEELSGLPIEVADLPWERPELSSEEAERRAGGPVLDEADLEPVLAEERERLAPIEHARLRDLSGEVVSAVDAVAAAVEVGTREDEVASAAAAALLSRGMRVPVLLAAADDRIERYRHPLPTARTARRRMMVIVVAERHGLHVAMTRIAELEPPSEDLRRRSAATESVLDAMIGATRAGATLGGVLQAARAAYADAGFEDEWRLHHQGGTIGYAPRERIATPGDGRVLEPGMATAWNPSITGTKAEATLLVSDGDPELLLR